MESKLKTLAARRGETPIVDRGAVDTRLYHRCRNPKCRCKLPEPADNPHKAFCCRGCYNSFYKTQCVVCEHDKPAGRSDRKFCRRPKCRSRYSRNAAFYAYPVSSTVRATDSSKSARKSGIKTGQFGPRPWRIVAGPPPSEGAFRAATVPDGPDTQWAGGSIERIEAANRRALEAYFDKLDSTAIDYCSVCHREDDLVDYKVGDQWVTT